MQMVSAQEKAALEAKREELYKAQLDVQERIRKAASLGAMIGAGLWGMEKELTLDAPPVEGSAYMVKDAERLPRTLQEATARLSQSQLAREVLGEELVDHFVRTREWEWRQFRDAVTDWELRRYFEVI